MITAATKIKSTAAKTAAKSAATAAIAAIFAAGFAATATAQSSNPFAGGEAEPTAPIERRVIPTNPNLNPNLNPNRGNQFSNPTRRTNPYVSTPNRKPEFRTNPFAGNDRQGTQFGNADARLARFLVGKWNGRLTNGQTVKVAFLQDGRFAIAINNSDVAQVGRYTVSGGAIRLRLSAMCSLTTKRCQTYNQVKALTIGFRPLNRGSIQVKDGTLHRIA